MRIYIAQQNYIIGDIAYNKNKILQALKHAESSGADIVLFSELCLCGYPPKDLLEREKLISACRVAVDEIATNVGDMLVIIGAPSINPQKEGKSLYNSAYCLHKGSIIHVVHKTLLPTYDIFSEYRYFEPARDWKCVEFRGEKIAVTICEDIWDIEEDPLYSMRPLNKLVQEEPLFILNLSASPYSYAHREKRNAVVRHNALYYNKPLIYCNTVGAQTDLIFDGASVVCNDKGEITDELKPFEEDSLLVDISRLIHTEEQLTTPVPYLSPASKVSSVMLSDAQLESVHAALILGIRDYFRKSGFRKAVIASSGGLDSALTLALAVEALGSSQVHAVLMPSEYSSDHSVSDAVRLSENFETSYDIVHIRDMYNVANAALQAVFKDDVFNVTQENIQSRLRGLVAMAYSNKYGHILLNTSNKSELSTGYGTLYGDMAGGLSVIGDLYKSQAYQLARYINRGQERIPDHILTKPPSAELRPDQKDADSLPEYDILDEILYKYINRNRDAHFISSLGFDPDVVNRVLQLVNMNEYKRFQFCPVLRVSDKAFGYGRQIPLVRHISLAY